MTTCISTTTQAVRQAARKFKRDYPHHAQEYAAHLDIAEAIAKRKLVWRDETLGFLVGEINRENVYKVANKQCACGESVCSHRLAVNLAVFAEEIAERQEAKRRAKQSIAVAEANEVQAELAEPSGAGMYP